MIVQYPHLIAELIRRNWTDDEIGDLAGRNFLRIFKKVEQISLDLKETKIYEVSMPVLKTCKQD